jgi:hypothetical protein
MKGEDNNRFEYKMTQSLSWVRRATPRFTQCFSVCFFCIGR